MDTLETQLMIRLLADVGFRVVSVDLETQTFTVQPPVARTVSKPGRETPA